MPDFGSREYWEARFTRNKTPFDWLIPAHDLRDIVTNLTTPSALAISEILHIGSGTSNVLSLRSLVAEPQQVHNVDFSEAAIEQGSQLERESLTGEVPVIEVNDAGVAQNEKHVSSQLMRWSRQDFLNVEDILDLLDAQSKRKKFYDLVIDKSTSYSIACAPSVLVKLPYALSINGWTQGIQQSAMVHSEAIHPLHVLAVHLAALTAPTTGKWIIVSYSEDRLPFVPPLPTNVAQGLLDRKVVQAGFPDPADLWTLLAKEKIEIRARDVRDPLGNIVHRSTMSHWLYVLVRTNIAVF